MFNPHDQSTWPPVLGRAEMCAILGGIAESTLRELRRSRNWAFADAQLVGCGRKPLWSRDRVLAALTRGALPQSFRRSA